MMNNQAAISINGTLYVISNHHVVVFTKIRDSLEIRCQSPHQPQQLQVTMAFLLQLTARTGLIKISVDI